MGKSEATRAEFVNALKVLIMTSPLDKITVTEIVSISGKTRQTFYRNFKDKYDLVNWHFECLADKSFRQMGKGLTLKEGLNRKLNFIKQEQSFFAAAFQSEDYNSLAAYDYECILDFYQKVIMNKTGQRTLDREIQFLLEMYCKGSVYMTVEWARRDMDLTPEKMTALLIQALPCRLEELLTDLK